MRNLLFTTVLLMGVASGAYAQNATSSGPVAAAAATALPLAPGNLNTSVTITTANTFQMGVAANTSRKAGSIYNSSLTTGDTCRVYFGTLANATVANSRPLAAGSTMTMASQAAVNVSCPATTDTLISDEQQ